VCTRNRAESLRAFLLAASQLRRPPGWSMGLLVVDNGSTDTTRAVFQQEAPRLPMHATIVTEPKPGLSAARNAALRISTADVIAFTDDDCLPQADWAEALSAHLDQCLSVPTVLGGRVELHNPQDLPMTINTSRIPRLVQTPTLELSSFLGCNMVIPRSVVQRVGGFDETLGAGARFHSAEDWDYLYRALCNGFVLKYCPDVVVFHNHGRRNARDRARLRRGYAIGAGALYWKHWRIADRQGLKKFYWWALAQARTLLKPRPGPDALSRADCARYLWHLAQGFMAAAFSSVSASPVRKAWRRASRQ
jgi:GT2 family glycosyltransferase